MIILGIESSCDETACAVVQKSGNRVIILSNVVASSAKLQEKFGGVIPEQAAREQIKSVIPVIEEALNQAFSSVIPADAGIQRAISSQACLSKESSSELDPRLRGDDNIRKIDAIAVTYGPGLIGSLLVGVETAKTLALVWDKPLIPVNHLLGHFYANWITDHLPGVKAHLEGVFPKFPAIGLLVSGGHTDLILMIDHNEYKYLGGTRDDAAGECFDKSARLLGLPYPGGPALASLAREGNPKSFALPRPMIDSKDFEFSFSGLKTAVANLVHSSRFTVSSSKNDERITNNELTNNLCASIEAAIVDVLVTKTIKAAQKFNVKQIIVAGGVAANQKLSDELHLKIENCKLKINLHIPDANLCTDNAAMIATCALFNYHPVDPAKVQADPNLAL